MSPSVSRNRPEVTGSSRRTRAGHVITREFSSQPAAETRVLPCSAGSSFCPRRRTATVTATARPPARRPARGASIPASRAGKPAGTLNPVPAAPSARAAARAIPSPATWCSPPHPQSPAPAGHSSPAPPAGETAHPHGQQRPPALARAQPTSPQSPGGYLRAGADQGSLRAVIRFPALLRAERRVLTQRLLTICGVGDDAQGISSVLGWSRH
jgi:hypothetical protein